MPAEKYSAKKETAVLINSAWNAENRIHLNRQNKALPKKIEKKQRSCTLRTKKKKQENKRQYRKYIDNLKEGVIIKFGSYPFESDGTEKPIEWEILEKNEDGTAIILSSKGIDTKPYNTEKEDITWAECSLRRWLNDEFYSKAFTAKEKDAIVEVSLKNKDNIGEVTQELVDFFNKHEIDLSPYKGQKWHTRGGEYTTDKVWLLSLEDMKRYGRRFSMDTSRIAMPTPYAKERGVYTAADYGGSCWWWLRSPGDLQYSAAFVHYYGDVNSLGYYVSYSYGAVRVALKINLNNL